MRASYDQDNYDLVVAILMPEYLKVNFKAYFCLACLIAVFFTFNWN